MQAVTSIVNSGTSGASVCTSHILSSHTDKLYLIYSCAQTVLAVIYLKRCAPPRQLQLPSRQTHVIGILDPEQIHHAMIYDFQNLTLRHIHVYILLQVPHVPAAEGHAGC